MMAAKGCPWVDRKPGVIVASRVVDGTRFRLPLSALLGALFTAWFFTALSVLIDAPSDTGDRVPIAQLGFTRLRPPDEIEPKVRRVKPLIEKPIQAPTRPVIDVFDDEGFDWDLDLERIGPGFEKGIRPPGGDEHGGPRRGGFGGLFQLGDSDPLPHVRVEPAYPPQASRRGLEGWVHVRFTVTTAGSVVDVVVVRSSHPVFERAAVAAARKWKYQPALEAGQPIESRQETVIRFQMDAREG
jgi:TonB family protein